MKRLEIYEKVTCDFCGKDVTEAAVLSKGIICYDCLEMRVSGYGVTKKP